MDFYCAKKLDNFIGREFEVSQLASILEMPEPQIIVVYGRRRVGKTALIEHCIKDRNVLKIEGIEGKSKLEQIKSAILQLRIITREDISTKTNKISTWTEFFYFIYEKYQNTTPLTLYLEELQWLADYEDDLISELKYCWDNYLSKMQGLAIILCGSAPSFMINKVVFSKALHNRSQHEINLKPFSLKESHNFLGERYTQMQVLDAYLSIGGIPEYLKYLQNDASILVGLANNSFKSNAFFLKEADRIFVSSLSNNPHYREIIELLAKLRFCDRTHLLKKLSRKSGGDISQLLDDLIATGFIERYSPFYINKDSSKLTRYQIKDNYLQFYYKFMLPLKKEIDNGAFNKSPISAINRSSLDTWFGYAFERLCRTCHLSIAKILGFSGVHYRYGVFFNRATTVDDSSFQWDLIFDRDDRVITLCEIKYYRNKAPRSVVDSFAKRLEFLPDKILKNKSLQRILIATQGASNELSNSFYFDRIIDLESLWKEL